jgi:hypothetical protein
MLKHLGKIKFLGDLSLEDADVLAKYAKQSNNILEFGCGGSTHIFSQSGANLIVSVDTSPEWIARTKLRVNDLNNKTVPYFWEYDNFFSQGMGVYYDLIFVDGVDSLRRDFAIRTWDLLKSDGVMIFHDTRRFVDAQNAAWIYQLHSNSIKLIEVNCAGSNGVSSNITVIHKKQLENYVYWHEVEKKPEWAYGDINYEGELQSWQ